MPWTRNVQSGNAGRQESIIIAAQACQAVAIPETRLNAVCTEHITGVQTHYRNQKRGVKMNDKTVKILDVILVTLWLSVPAGVLAYALVYSL